MASSQPISLPSVSNNTHINNSSGDYTMASGSYTGSPSSSFNPASYTKHFLGSPVSWRAGSFGFGGRSVGGAGSPMDYFLGSIECRPTSFESDRDSIANARQLFEREEQLCRDYTCCGIRLTDLHALIEHFEEVHVVVVSDQPTGQQYTQIQIPFNPQPMSNGVPPPTSQSSITPQTQPQNHLASQATFQSAGQAQNVQNQYPVPFDPDDMELEMDVSQSYPQSQTFSSRSSPSSGVPTPPDTPVSTPHSSYPSPTGYGPLKPFGHHSPQLQTLTAQGSLSPYNSPYTSQPPSPHSYHPPAGVPIAAFETTDGRRHSATPSTLGSVSTTSEGFAQDPEAMSARPSLNLNLSSFSRAASGSPIQHVSYIEPFTAYSPFANGAIPGTTTEVPVEGVDFQTNSVQAMDDVAPKTEGCVPPALLFSNAPTPEDTPAPSRATSPTPSHAQQSHSAIPSQVPGAPTSMLSSSNGPAPVANTPVPGSSGTTVKLPATLPRGPSLMLSSSKPFKCPKPGCNKSYKQANGLKYHITHGSCNFNPPKDLEHVQAILEKKRRDRADAEGLTDDGLSTPHSPSEYAELGLISETELREVEAEAEKRVKPFACGVGDCLRRYKNMNGLRYHYQHSGEHGVIGLGLLATGMHECLNNGTTGGGSRDREGRKSRAASKPSSRAPSTSRTGTPVPPPVAVAQVQASLSQQQPTPSIHPQPPSPKYTPTPSSLAHALQLPPSLAAQSKPPAVASAPVTPIQPAVSYQQQLVDHQRQFVQQQEQQIQQMQAQFAALQSQMYSGSIDVTMAG